MWGPCKGRGVGEEDGETGFGMGEAAFVLPPQSQREEEGARKFREVVEEVKEMCGQLSL